MNIWYSSPVSHSLFDRCQLCHAGRVNVTEAYLGVRIMYSVWMGNDETRLWRPDDDVMNATDNQEFWKLLATVTVAANSKKKEKNYQKKNK